MFLKSEKPPARDVVMHGVHALDCYQDLVHAAVAVGVAQVGVDEAVREHIFVTEERHITYAYLIFLFVGHG